MTYLLTNIPNEGGQKETDWSELLPIEDTLHVVVVISNPCLYRRRYALAREFIARMLKTPRVSLYVVELCYLDQSFQVTDAINPRHLQIYTETAPLWHKENMINMGVRRLLPENWRAMAWIDADIEFKNPQWAYQTLQILNGTSDVVQLFDCCLDLGQNGEILNRFQSAGFMHKTGGGGRKRFGHPGFAWACNRLAYERMGGLFEQAILGSGDNIMLCCILGKSDAAVGVSYSEEYITAIRQYESRARGLQFGYVPGVIQHHFHGNKKNRRYTDRWQILIQYGFSPAKHLAMTLQGLVVPSEQCPPGLLAAIMDYFRQRNEDE